MRVPDCIETEKANLISRLAFVLTGKHRAHQKIDHHCL